VRLRLLVPRRGRGRGLGRLAVAAVAALAAIALVVALTRGDGEEGQQPALPPTATPTATPTPVPTPPPPPALDVPASGPSLAVGITEPNPNLIAAADVRPVPPEWTRWRDELARIRPALYRLVVDWSAVQPTADAAPNLDAPNGGCMRDKGPCAPYAGVRDQLRALASRQREGGWQALVLFTSTPAWAAGTADGCRLSAGFAAPRSDVLAAYRRLIAELIAAAAQEGVELRYFSPWNEPNHPYFLAPQRSSCDAAAPSLAPARYAALARALRAELTAQRGDQRLVLGETAGILRPTPRATSVPELIRALPRELVCSAPVWSQHAYIGGTDPVAAVEEALDARRCPRQAIWITETGVGPAPEGLSLARGITSERQGCRLLHERLEAWHDDPRVTVAVQYTFREDDRFPTGLVTTDLARARRALDEWQAWGARGDPDEPPPAASC
jgi:hypothetical protein